MEATVVLRRKGNALWPVDETGEEVLAKIAQGRDVLVKLHAPRNVMHHRKMFALLKVVVDNTDAYPTVDALLTALKLALGHHDWLKLPNGSVVPVPKSISFASMDQSSFNKFYDAAVDMIVRYVLKGTDSETLERQVLEIIGEGQERAA